MESVELMAREIDSSKNEDEKIPAEISGLLEAVRMLTDKVNDLVVSYANAKSEPEEVEVVDEEKVDETEEVEE
jgi:hypothetical protein